MQENKTTTGKLGFGLMRLPSIDKEGTVDIGQVKDMVDRFMDAGFTYYDSAYVYGAGKSEKAAGEALVRRYPRDSFTLATKVNARAAKDAADAKAQFNISCDRFGTDYIDYYLLHAISKGNYDMYRDFGLWEYQKQLKAEGKVKQIGFSFHDTPEFLEQVLTEHPDVDFVQLQINYVDWTDPKVCSGGVYEVAHRHGKPIIVMEPVKGGTLANPPAEVARLLASANPSATPASWAIRYAASLDGVLTVLSGMSNMEQMENNLSYMRNFQPLSKEELEVIHQAQAIFAGYPSIPCTACRYCTPGCPMEIQIPDIFNAYNTKNVFADNERASRIYENAVKNGGKPVDCVACGQCEDQCPQKIQIIEKLQECAALFDNQN